MSLDGFIAGPNGEVDWIVPDSGIDFAAIFARYDILLMGRKTYEVASQRSKSWDKFGQQWVVVSRTLNPADHPGVTVLASNIPESVAALKHQPGKNIWLWGGGVLFRCLLDAGLVDGVDVSIMPVLLGSGVPMLPAGHRQRLQLYECETLPSGILLLHYSLPAKSPAQ
jgi:dihydrofolate reductase